MNDDTQHDLQQGDKFPEDACLEEHEFEVVDVADAGIDAFGARIQKPVPVRDGVRDTQSR